MSPTSIGESFHKVKSPASPTCAFRLPNVIAIQRGDSYRKVFACLYSLSNENGLLELDALRLKALTGLSRKTVYKVVSFLQRVNLLRLVEARTGRGKHSLYRLNWRKPRKCHPPYPLVSKRKGIHPSGDKPMAQIISPQNRQLWNRCLKSFRELLEQSKLSKGQQQLCTCVLGRHLKGKARDYGLRLYVRLLARIWQVRPPGWVKSVQALCRWFMGVLKGLFNPRQQLKRRRFRDYNEYLAGMHRQELERVMTRRGERPESAEEAWERWHREQEAERAWIRKRAELARQGFGHQRPSWQHPCVEQGRC